MARANAALAAGIPGARVVQIANVDHVIEMRVPEAFNDAVLSFLAEVAPW
jgi:pimeloyl-ACP methyl ester carboxylesterase